LPNHCSIFLFDPAPGTKSSSERRDIFCPIANLSLGSINFLLINNDYFWIKLKTQTNEK
jgi:hypothetical protein